MAVRQKTFTPDVLQDIYAQLADLKEAVRTINKRPTWIERVNPVTLPDPVEGQVAIDARTNCFIYYSNHAWREKCGAVHAIKIYPDRALNKVEDGAFRFPVEEDLDGTVIEQVQLFNGIPGTGATTIEVQNITRGIDILSSPLTLASGGTITTGQAAINEGGPTATPNNMVNKGDMIWINTTAVATGSKGAGCYIFFHGAKVDLTP